MPPLLYREVKIVESKNKLCRGVRGYIIGELPLVVANGSKRYYPDECLIELIETGGLYWSNNHQKIKGRNKSLPYLNYL